MFKGKEIMLMQKVITSNGFAVFQWLLYTWGSTWCLWVLCLCLSPN